MLQLLHILVDWSDVACCAAACPLNLYTRYLGPMPVPVYLFFVSAPKKTNVVSHKPSFGGGGGRTSPMNVGRWNTVKGLLVRATRRVRKTLAWIGSGGNSAIDIDR